MALWADSVNRFSKRRCCGTAGNLIDSACLRCIGSDMIRLFSMLLSAIVLLTGFLVTPAFGLIYVSNIRHWAAPDYTRVVIDTSDEATYTVVKESRRMTLTVKKADVAEDVP